MKIQLLQENLLKSLVRTGRTVANKPQLPILQNVFIEANDGKISFTTSNLETSETVSVGGKVETEGTICIPSKLFTELVASYPQETVTLHTEDQMVSITAGKFRATLPGMGGDEFPRASIAIPTMILIEKETFLEGLEMVLFAAATDESRPLLTGVRMVKNTEGVRMAATDGYRLSVKTFPLNTPDELDMVVSARVLAEVVRVVKEEKEGKTISFGQSTDGQIVFQINDTEIQTRLLSGEYPNVEKIIPKTHTTRMTIETESFAKAVKSAAILARDNAHIIKLTIGQDGVQVGANAPQIGEGSVDVDATVEGDGGEMAFNSRFLTEFLSHAPTGEIIFEMTGSLNPGLFRFQGNESFLHVIMPVRVQQ